MILCVYIIQFEHKTSFVSQFGAYRSVSLCCSSLILLLVRKHQPSSARYRLASHVMFTLHLQTTQVHILYLFLSRLQVSPNLIIPFY